MFLYQRTKLEDWTCESGGNQGKTPPGGRLCEEPWYNATEHPESQQPGWQACHILHGVLMTAPFSVFLPLGALGPHIGFLASTKLAFHRNCMFLGQYSLLIGFGFGVWLAFMSGEVCVPPSSQLSEVCLTIYCRSC